MTHTIKSIDSRLRAIARLNSKAEQAIRHWEWWSRTERYKSIVARVEYFRRVR